MPDPAPAPFKVTRESVEVELNTPKSEKWSIEAPTKEDVYHIIQRLDLCDLKEVKD